MTVSQLSRRTDQLSSRLERARQAAARARRLQGDRVGERVIEVLPAIASLLPDGGLKPGATYRVDGSTALVSALIAGPSADGLWCAIVGMPGFAAEAAAGIGCDLEHLVFVPQPGRDWVNVVAALVDALAIVVVRPRARVSDAEAARLSARLRQRESVLIACGGWPRAEARLSVSTSTWFGLGPGHGHLTSRRVTVAVSGRGGRRDQAGPAAELWLPDARGEVRLVEDAAPLAAATMPRDIAAGEFQQAVS